jgi:hypothetical protein
VDLYIGGEKPIHAAARTSVGADGKHAVYLPARSVSLATFR